MTDKRNQAIAQSTPTLRVFVGSALLSIAYLISEVVFNVVLLDVAGGISTADEIEQVELFGRALSSTGFGLLIGRWIYRRSLKKGNWDAFGAALMSMVLAACLFGTVQHFGIKAFSQSRSIDDKMDAYMLVTLKQGIARNNVSIKGLEYLNERLDKPESKALLTLFGPLVYSNATLRETLKSNDLHYVKTIAEQEHAKHVAHIYNAYVEISNKRADLARLYHEVESALLKRINDEAHAAYDRLWAQHSRTNRNVRRNTISGKRYYNTLNRHFRRAAGFALPPAPWTLDQKSAFIRYFTQRTLNIHMLDTAINEAASKVDSRLRFDFTRHPDLRFSLNGRDFIETQYAQAPLHAALLEQPDFDLFLVEDIEMSDGLKNRQQATQGRISIPWGLQFDAFSSRTQAIFQNNLWQAHSANLDAIRSSMSGERDTAAGARYIEALWVPAIALCLSMMMIVLNLYSLVAMIVRYPFAHHQSSTVRTSSSIASHGVALAVCALLLLAPYSHEHLLADNATYQSVLTRTTEVAPVPAHIMDWTLRAEPLLFNVGEPLMNFGQSFDFIDSLGNGQSDVFVL